MKYRRSSAALIPASFSARQHTLATVYTYAIGGAFAVNLTGLVNLSESQIDEIKVEASLGPDFCYHLEQATIAVNEAIADKAQEYGSFNEAWAIVDSVLDNARCQCANGTEILPPECLDFWIETPTAGPLLGDARGADSLARISKSRAQIYFDPSDHTATRVFVNTTKKIVGQTVVEYAVDTANNVTSSMSGDTLVITWHLVNGACRDSMTMPCVAISGTARFRKNGDGSMWHDIDRDAFPSLAYFRKSPASCSFTPVFISSPRRLPFNMDFLNLIPILPNKVHKSGEDQPNTCIDES